MSLYPVAEDFAATMIAGRSKGMDRAFKAIEYVRSTSHAERKSLIVLIAAGLTPCQVLHSFGRIRCRCVLSK